MRELLRRATFPAAAALILVSLAVTAGAKWSWPYEQTQDLLLRGVTGWLRFTAALAVIAVLAVAWRARAGIALHRQWLAGALLVSLVGPLAAGYLAPRGHKLYFDEDIYMQVGVSMAVEDRAGLLDLSLPDPSRPAGWRGTRWTLNKEPSGCSFLFSLGVPFFGVDDRLGERVNLVVFGLAIFGLALFLRESPFFAGRPRSQLLAPLAFALWPENLRWAVCAIAEPGAVMLAAWTLALGARAGRTRRSLDRFAACATGVLASQMRPESILILIPLGVLLWGLPQRRPGHPDLSRARFLEGARASTRDILPWAAMVAVLLLPHTAHIASSSHEDWGAGGPKFTTAVLAENTLHNFGYWFMATPAGRNTPAAPAAWFPLALVGLATAIVQAARLRRGLSDAAARGVAWITALLFWGGLFFGIFLPFYAGSYHYGVDVRFSLLVVPVYAVLVALGADAIARGIARGFPSRWMRALGRSGARPIAGPRFLAAVLLLLLPLARALSQVPVVTEEAWQARADHEAVAVFAEGLPRDAVVISHTPFQWALRRVAAVQVVSAWPDPGLVGALTARGPVFYHQNYWDVMPPANGAVAEAVTMSRLFRDAYVTDTFQVVEARSGISFALLAVGPRRQVALEPQTLLDAPGDEGRP